MIDISVTGLVKAYELKKNILDGLSFNIDSGERVGLLGKNGAGKTTLFKILTGELDYDEGDVVVGTGKAVGLISQIPRYPEDYTVERVLDKAFDRLHSIKGELNQLERRMAEESESKPLIARYGELMAAYEGGGGYQTDTELSKVCNGLAIPQAMRQQLFSSLSGGEKTRVNLARLILEKTDILLLDEPTNHLDMRSVTWLEEYLLRFKGTVLVISHDRYFLDRVVNRIIEIEKGKAEFYTGNYSFYVKEKEARYQEQLKRYEREQAKAAQLNEAAARLHQWGTGNQALQKRAFAIEKRVERLTVTERPKKEKTMKARFGETEFNGDEVLVIKGLSKAYGEKVLFNNLELEMIAGERVAIIGDNGTGKTTLLRILLGEEEPDSGRYKLGPSIHPAFLPQIVRFNNPQLTLLDTLLYDLDLSPQSARNRLGAFKFSGEDVFKSVSQLSGGEQTRLRLCMLMEDEINLLILDEPTNHLDIASREWIEECVTEYEGALIFVSHDRYFINRFATRIWVMENGGLIDFQGSYGEYTASLEKGERLERLKKQTEKKKPKPCAQKPPEKIIAELEKKISVLEERQRALEAEIEASACNYELLSGLYIRQSELESELSQLMDEWMDLMEEQG